MFNFVMKSDEISVRYRSTASNRGTPNVHALFGDWWALAGPDLA